MWWCTFNNFNHISFVNNTSSQTKTVKCVWFLTNCILLHFVLGGEQLRNGNLLVNHALWNRCLTATAVICILITVSRLFRRSELVDPLFCKILTRKYRPSLAVFSFSLISTMQVWLIVVWCTQRICGTYLILRSSSIVEDSLTTGVSLNDLVYPCCWTY